MGKASYTVVFIIFLQILHYTLSREIHRTNDQLKNKKLFDHENVKKNVYFEINSKQYVEEFLDLDFDLENDNAIANASFIHVCKRNDPELEKCFIKAFKEIRPYLKKGIPELDLPPGEPLHYFNITASTGKGTSVTLEGSVWNQIATGLLDVEIKDIKLDFEHARWSGTFFFPFVRLQGDYKFKGKVLLLEIDTTGPFDVNGTDINAKTEWFGKFQTKNGKQYIEFEKVDLAINIRDISVYYTNLINGNEVLTETLNKAINENIQSIKEELDPVIERTLSGVALQYFNKFFGLFSLDELFPSD